MSTPYSYAAPGRRVRPVSVAVGLLLAGTLIFTVAGLVKAGPGVWNALAEASFQSRSSLQAVAVSVGRGLSVSTLNPWYWGFVAVLTVLQWFWPARRDQRNLSVDMAVDAVWFVMGNALQFTIVAITLGAVTVAYSELLGKWSLNLQPTLGFWGLAISAFVLTDLLAWVSHWCHHKVRTLWRFHAVHHSQQRLNALSDNRTHVGEVVAAALIVFVPSELLGLNASVAEGLAFIGIYYSAMLHSNIRTNLGPFKYVFMGPQPHRIHHSILAQHFECNYGTVFSWWDFLAGTMYRGFDEYPPTGIADTHFPLRDQGDFNPLRWLVIFFKQLAYPLEGIRVDWLTRQTKHVVPTSAASAPRDVPWHRHEGHEASRSTTAVRGSADSQNYRLSDWLPVGSGRRRPKHCATGCRCSMRRDLHPLTVFDCRNDMVWTIPQVKDTSADCPAADWYDNPVGEGLRFWDGAAWTEHVAPTAATVASPQGFGDLGQTNPYCLTSTGTAEPMISQSTDAEGCLSGPHMNPHAGRTSARRPAADWYDNPVGEGLRYWDGAAWTVHVAPAAVTVQHELGALVNP